MSLAMTSARPPPIRKQSVLARVQARACGTEQSANAGPCLRCPLRSCAHMRVREPVWTDGAELHQRSPSRGCSVQMIVSKGGFL
eukprot:CAMPEP_0171098932 /NCGR_PEP_ID=MMETSP0766_2-20121228/49902_1 /TAXON_ID=439317 /ORGANISM="Gambierdiscus australes, Strain CAWD 149" /LENGTH=83 /DNA_ID=CAMNT_0011558419 /DNA_START=56 /DNA_END=304 /DNA_ORIENTATION=-